ncbi:hypothetical protein ACIHCX_03670 [Streptomyces sp. NPDC052043]|uniref:hypothetical protein n=1 Tax=Streptomyces sp. NPDC052043 TaxID=3365684 RepID=UPI0037D5EDC3
MTRQQNTTDDEQASLAAGRAAGYCWAQRPEGPPGRCTRRPDHDGDHMDHYAGRRSVTDVVGYRWPQR